MAGVFIVFTALLLCLPDLSDGINVHQSPPSLFESPGHSAELQCSHDDSSYYQMYWYQQSRKGALELIGYLSYTEISLTVTFASPLFHCLRVLDSLLNSSVLIILATMTRCTGPSQGIGVSQTPQVLLQGAGGSAGMFCEHDGDSSYTQMYWYRQLRGQGIQLLVFSDFYKDPEFEKDFSKERYEVNRSAVTKGSLKIKNLEPDFSDGINVHQSPLSLFESPGRSTELNCSHDASSYQYMCWYQQTRKGALELIGYLNNEIVNPEGKFKERFILTGDARKADPSQGIGVSQTPQVLLQGAGGSAGMFCEHDGDSTYIYMYWYRQLRGQGIQSLVFSVFGSAPQFEKDFNEDRYEVNRPTATKGSLKIKNLELGDSALYFCSASKHSDTIPLQHLAKSTLPSLLPALVL
ncbi:UNVERIFIED_CONTAM: hypothetical protein FKN15_074677 [Acipenser sinensis]